MQNITDNQASTPIKQFLSTKIATFNSSNPTTIASMLLSKLSKLSKTTSSVASASPMPTFPSNCGHTWHCMPPLHATYYDDPASTPTSLPTINSTANPTTGMHIPLLHTGHAPSSLTHAKSELHGAPKVLTHGTADLHWITTVVQNSTSQQPMPSISPDHTTYFPHIASFPHCHLRNIAPQLSENAFAVSAPYHAQHTTNTCNTSNKTTMPSHFRH